MSPCNTCIVNPICINPCDQMLEYLGDKIMDYKPEGGPKSSLRWLTRTCIKIRKSGTICIKASICVDDLKYDRCLIYIENKSVVKIEKEYIHD